MWIRTNYICILVAGIVSNNSQFTAVKYNHKRDSFKVFMCIVVNRYPLRFLSRCHAFRVDIL